MLYKKPLDSFRDSSDTLIKKGYDILNKDLESNHKSLNSLTRYHILKELNRHKQNRLAWYGVFIPDILGLFDSIDWSK